ncbi:hypothetical protein BDV19DRAFT_373824 [Aspergillus venezuelensis]
MGHMRSWPGPFTASNRAPSPTQTSAYTVAIGTALGQTQTSGSVAQSSRWMRYAHYTTFIGLAKLRTIRGYGAFSIIIA